MIDKERVVKVIFKAIDETNEQLAKDAQIKKDSVSVLLGPNSVLDSLGSAVFFSAVEAKVKEEFKIEITLLNENVLSHKDNPFATMGKFIDYICDMLNES